MIYLIENSLDMIKFVQIKIDKAEIWLYYRRLVSLT